jgi:ribosomal-protein-alanine N-acetyltransferase
MTLDDAFTHLPSICTRKLVLRQIRTADAGPVHSFKCDPEITWLYAEDPHRSVDETEAWIQSNLDAYGQRTAMTWAIFPQGGERPIGECCLWNIDEDARQAEIGFELHPDHWGQGLMMEALEALLRFAFIDLGMGTIVADTLDRNPRSERLLRRLGFRELRVMKADVPLGQEGAEQRFFSLSEGEWKDRR